MISSKHWHNKGLTENLKLKSQNNLLLIEMAIKSKLILIRVYKKIELLNDSWFEVWTACKCNVVLLQYLKNKNMKKHTGTTRKKFQNKCTIGDFVVFSL